MHLQRLLGFVAVAVVTAVACQTVTAADEPGVHRKLKSIAGAIASSPDSLGGAIAAEPKGNVAVSYGFVTVAEKRRFTYFLIFKVDPAKIEGGGSGIGFKGLFGPDAGDFRMEVGLGNKKIDFAYDFKVDRKAGTITESIKIGGKDYSKDVPRVFLVDLTQDKITYVPLKDAIPDPAGDVDEVAKALNRLEEKNEQVKEFFAGKAKK